MSDFKQLDLKQLIKRMDGYMMVFPYENTIRVLWREIKERMQWQTKQ